MPRPPRCLDVLAIGGGGERTVRLAACMGGIYLQTRPGQSLWLGNCDETDSYCVQIVPLPPGDNNGGYVFVVGARKRNHLRVWHWSDSATAADASAVREIVFDSAKYGFGYAMAKRRETTNNNDDDADDFGWVLYLATGLGKGIARVWELDPDTLICRLALQCKAKVHTILAMHLDSDLNLFVGTNDSSASTTRGGHFCQQWQVGGGVVDQKAKHVLSTVQSRAAILQLTSDAFLRDVAIDNDAAANQEADLTPKQYIDLHASEWKSLFPEETLDPLAYVGERDATSGLPHGEGRQMVASTGFIFRGRFAHGRAVRGSLERPDRQPFYWGEVDGETLQQHGMGREERHPQGGGVEVYLGGFLHGQRHGLFRLRYENTSASKSDNHGVFDYGFYHHGTRRGLAWRIWHKSSPSLPFPKGRERETKRELGGLGCIQVYNSQQHQPGVVVSKDEFNFFCLSGKRIAGRRLKQLVNVAEVDEEGRGFANPTFQRDRQGVYEDRLCWSCMEEAEEEEEEDDEDDDSKVWECVACGMRVHSACAWPVGMFAPKWFGSWACPRCDDMFRLGSHEVLVKDRHGDLVAVRNLQELRSVVVATPSSSGGGVVGFAERDARAFAA